MPNPWPWEKGDLPADKEADTVGQYQPKVTVPPDTPQWEYTVQEFSFPDGSPWELGKQMNLYGAACWELVSYEPVLRRAIFKRPIVVT